MTTFCSTLNPYKRTDPNYHKANCPSLVRLEARWPTQACCPGEGLSLTAPATPSLLPSGPMCDPIDGSPPGFPIPGILQARTLAQGCLAVTSLTLTPGAALEQPWPRSSRNEGLIILHGMETNHESSLQTEEEAGLS